MSAAITIGNSTVAAGRSKESIRDAIERAFHERKTADACFELIVTGHEAEIIRYAMRRYCEPPSQNWRSIMVGSWLIQKCCSSLS